MISYYINSSFFKPKYKIKPPHVENHGHGHLHAHKHKHPHRRNSQGEMVAVESDSSFCSDHFDEEDEAGADYLARKKFASLCETGEGRNKIHRSILAR